MSYHLSTLSFQLISRFLPILLWMVQIFGSSAHSNPADMLPRFIVRFIWNTTIFGQRLFFLLGPLGHMVNFGVLAFLIARAIVWEAPLRNRHLLYAFLLSLLYGVTDEVHQYFVPQRAFQVIDIFIDAFGALLGLGVYAFYRLKRAQKLKEETLML